MINWLYLTGWYVCVCVCLRDDAVCVLLRTLHWHCSHQQLRSAAAAGETMPVAGQNISNCFACPPHTDEHSGVWLMGRPTSSGGTIPSLPSPIATNSNTFPFGTAFVHKLLLLLLPNDVHTFHNSKHCATTNNNIMRLHKFSN